MADIFISWGIPDEISVTRLYQRLLANGLEIFQYSEKMAAGDKIDARVNQEINLAQLVIFCLSDETLERPWIKEEIAWCRKSILDRRDENPPRDFIVVPVRVGKRESQLPELFTGLFEYDLTDPLQFEQNLEKLVGHIRDKLKLEAPLVIPAAVLAFTKDQFANLNEAAQKRLEPLCTKMGMQPSPDLEKVLARRYGPTLGDFSPFPGGKLGDQINSALQIANAIRKKSRRPPVWLWWCTEELFRGDDATKKFARHRWYTRPSLLVLDSLSLSIKQGDLLKPDRNSDLRLDYLDLAAYADPRNTALIWVPPYTEHTAGLELIIEEALQNLPPLDKNFGQWQAAESARYVAFDIGTAATLRRWLFSAFEDLEFEEPQPAAVNVAAMRRSFPAQVRTGGFFSRRMDGGGI